MRLNPTEELAFAGLGPTAVASPVPELRHQIVTLSEAIAQAVGGTPGVAPHFHRLALRYGWERCASPSPEPDGLIGGPALMPIVHLAWARRSAFPRVIDESDQQEARKRCNLRPCD